MSSNSKKLRFQKFRGLFIACFFFSYALPSFSVAQEPFQFDAIDRQETLRDQQILREQMRLQQQILSQEMERIRIEMQNIMKEISLAMKEEAVKLNDQQPSARDRGGFEDDEGLEIPLTLEEQKERFLNFANRIKILKKQIEAKSGNAAAELIELGYAYLEAQRFIDSREDIEKLTLLQFAEENNLPLGSYEQAARAFKIALSFNTNKAETHLTIGKIYDEVNDIENALMYARLAHMLFKKNKNSAKMDEAQNFIESLAINYGDKVS